MPESATASPVSPATLEALAQKLRRDSIIATSEAGSGHPTTCMSCAEIMSVLFFDEMRFDPQDPGARNTDAFVLSKGHAAPILWAALKEAGGIKEDLKTLRRFDSPLEGHPTPNSPWVRIATGSLGQGLPAALGIAIGKRMDDIPARVYCLMGDGESAEGSVWEAAQVAAYRKMDNLCAIVDVNALGQSGPTMLAHDVEAYVRRFEAFGWGAVWVDGHDIDALRKAFSSARELKGKPFAIIAKTDKGHGVKAVSGKPGWHGKPFKKGPEEESALKEIGDGEITIDVPARNVPAKRPLRPLEVSIDDPSLTPQYKLGQEVATREAFGVALAKLGKVSPVVVALDADTKNSTFSDKFKEAYPERFVDAFIAEQNMVGMALGLAAEGKIPFCSTFACFLSRAYDFVRMAVYSRPGHLVCVGTHAGISIGEDGASQMGLEDLAMFRALVASTVLYPSDAVSAERMTALAAHTPGIVYVRMSRPKSPVIYANDERFPLGGSKTLRQSEKDRATIVAAGVTVHEALKAHELLLAEGIWTRVIDAYSVKPLDVNAVRKAHRDTKRVFVVEDHSVAGGLGEAVCAAGVPATLLGVREIPRSGTPTELMEHYGISASAIVHAVNSW
jgi:transketolase